MTVMTSRTIKRWICGLLIGVFASAQVAAAVHACSSMPGAASSASAPSADSSQMNLASDRMGMDSMLSPVCVGHCQDGLQSADRPPLPAEPAAMLVGFYTVPPLAESSTRATPRPETGRTWASPDPPHEILHCCMRN